MHLIRSLRDCKQRSLTVSKKAPTVSKKASPKNNLHSWLSYAQWSASARLLVHVSCPQCSSLTANFGPPPPPPPNLLHPFSVYFLRWSGFTKFGGFGALFSYMGARQRSGEGVVRRNGCPKGCFWRVRFFFAPLRFSGHFRCFKSKP